MRKNIVLTVTGHDRIGIVEDVTKIVLDNDGNVEASRMARLGGEFTIVMLISVPENRYESLRESLRALREKDYKVTTRKTTRGHSAKYAGWLPYRVKVSGADHEGIIYHITDFLAEQGINIETMDTSMVPAPMSGTPLFKMSAVVLAPPGISYKEWIEALEDIGDSLNVDTEVEPYTG